MQYFQMSSYMEVRAGGWFQGAVVTVGRGSAGQDEIGEAERDLEKW